MRKAFQLFLKSERGLSENTVESYDRDLKHFESYLEGRDLLSVSREDIVTYLGSLQHNRTAARRLSCLRQFFAFVRTEGVRADNPAEMIDGPRWNQNLPKVLTEEAVDQLFAAAYATKDLRLCAMLEILYATGMRVSELIALKRSHFVLYDSCPVLTVRGKGDKERMVPLHDTAWKTVQEYLATVSMQGPIFPSPKGGSLSRQRVFQLLKELAVLANLDPDLLSPHVLRHAFATHMLKRGADLVFIKEILGHSHLSTSEIYLHVMPEDLAELVEKYHPIAKMEVPAEPNAGL